MKKLITLIILFFAVSLLNSCAATSTRTGIHYSAERIEGGVRVKAEKSFNLFGLFSIKEQPGGHEMVISKVFINQCLDLSIDAYENHTIECDRTDTQVLVKRVGKTLYIAFRGTSSGKDIKTDLRRFKSDYSHRKNGAVHTGFKIAYNSVADDVGKYVDDKSLLNVVITGHSLGGALSQLCGFDISRRFPLMPVQVVAFGSPRVGNSDFVRIYQKEKIPTYLIEHTLDLVTMTPLFGYKKVVKPSNSHRWLPSYHKTKSYRDTLA